MQNELLTLNVYFSDVFGVSADALNTYGAFNISLINDLPLFIDPFLLFHSDKPEYRRLHDDMIHYLRFLRDAAAGKSISDGVLESWFCFGEVKQTWLGYSRVGNKGSGLGITFAKALQANLHTVFSDFGAEQVTRSSHLEKLCVVRTGVGRDNISDFTTNLIKRFLLEYTQTFAQQHIRPGLRRRVPVQRVRFNYETESWENGRYELPYYNRDYVLLTPKDILTKDETWINRPDLIDDFHDVVASVSNLQLQADLNNYFRKCLPKDYRAKDERAAADATVTKFPQIIDYFIRYKEDRGNDATRQSQQKVAEANEQFVIGVRKLIGMLKDVGFYDVPGDTYMEARQRLLYLKHVIENQDGYRIFYAKNKPMKQESTLQLLYRFTWFASLYDVNREVNNGRGPVDYKVSYGGDDATLVEFKLASNTRLEQNLRNQVKVYEAANRTSKSLKAILYFSEAEYARVKKILNNLKLADNDSVILIDARDDNKPSGSRA